MELVLAILLFFVLSYMSLFFTIKKYKEYILKNNITNTYETVKVIDKNLIFITLAYIDKNPNRMYTLLFMIKTLFYI